MCNFLLDEVYVKYKLCYKVDKLEGVTMHSNGEKKNNVSLATTIQTFIISSIVRKLKI